MDIAGEGVSHLGSLEGEATVQKLSSEAVNTMTPNFVRSEVHTMILIMHTLDPHFVVLVRWFVRRTRDDERGAGFVDQDRVDLIDDAEVEGCIRAEDELRGTLTKEVRRTALIDGKEEKVPSRKHHGDSLQRDCPSSNQNQALNW